jgi:glycosyltransferase involved in cell wall biosynthesis
VSSTALVPAYDCVIATRNRINALKMSIPLILRQDMPPRRLIVVDASDDHESLRTEVGDIGDRLGFGNTVVVRSDRPSSSRQRNIGLQFVQAPIVMFPDDDSMWYAGFASSVIKVYQSDTREQVGGVGGVGVIAPPPELGQPAYKRSKFRIIKQAVQPYRSYIEQHAFPRPFDIIGASTWTSRIDVVDDINSKRLPHISGYRMSFRTDAVRRVGFDETLAIAQATHTTKIWIFPSGFRSRAMHSCPPKTLRSAIFHSRENAETVTGMGFAPSRIAYMFARRR